MKQNSLYHAHVHVVKARKALETEIELRGNNRTTVARKYIISVPQKQQDTNGIITSGELLEALLLSTYLVLAFVEDQSLDIVMP